MDGGDAELVGTSVIGSGVSIMIGGVLNAGNDVSVTSGLLNIVRIGSTDTLSLSSYTQLADPTSVNQPALDGGVLDASGVVAIEGGEITGFGTINGDVSNGAELELGGGVINGVLQADNQLSITGNYIQEPGGSLVVSVAGTMAASQYGQLDVADSSSLAGSLVIDLINGFEPTLGETFTTISANSSSGQFTNIDQSSVNGPIDFQPAYTADSVVLVAEKSSTTTLTSSVGPSVYGQPVTFTTQVTPTSPNTGQPTGSVTFFVGTTSLGTVTLAKGKATLETATLPSGTSAMTVTYSGDSSFATSTSATPIQTVDQNTTTTALSSSVNPSAFGQSITLTATVTVAARGRGTPTGSITFYDGSSPLATVSLSGKSAAFKTSALAVGQNGITAVYSGDTKQQNTPSPIP